MANTKFSCFSKKKKCLNFSPEFVFCVTCEYLSSHRGLRSRLNGDQRRFMVMMRTRVIALSLW